MASFVDLSWSNYRLSLHRYALFNNNLTNNNTLNATYNISTTISGRTYFFSFSKWTATWPEPTHPPATEHCSFEKKRTQKCTTPKGTTSNDLRGRRKSKKKNFEGPSPGKNKFWEALWKGFPGKNKFISQISSAPPPQIITGRPLREEPFITAEKGGLVRRKWADVTYMYVYYSTCAFWYMYIHVHIAVLHVCWAGYHGLTIFASSWLFLPGKPVKTVCATVKII